MSGHVQARCNLQPDPSATNDFSAIYVVVQREDLISYVCAAVFPAWLINSNKDGSRSNNHNNKSGDDASSDDDSKGSMLPYLAKVAAEAQGKWAVSVQGDQNDAKPMPAFQVA